MKYRIHKSAVIILALTITLAACRKESEVSDIINPNSRTCKTFTQQFEAVWNGMSQGYVFWGRDTVDWDARYEQYKPVFEEFDARPASRPVSAEEYNAAYQGLFQGLLDHHLYGMFTVPRAKYEAIVRPGVNSYYHDMDPGSERREQLRVLKDRTDLVPNSYYAYDPEDYGSFSIPGMYCALIKLKTGKNVAYFRFTNFYLSVVHEVYSFIDHVETVQEPLRKFFGPRYWEGITSEGSYANDESVVGIIIDLRGNGGGSTADLVPFIGSLSQSSTLVGYTRVKDGFGRLDYSPWSKYVIGCPRLHLQEQKPIVVLADINSVSCAELATMLIKNLPNGTFIGERTYGAVGALWPDSEHQHDYLYSGCFGDYNYYQYGMDLYRYKETYPYYVYTSTYHMVDCNYDDIEGVGVKPDIEVKFDRHSLMNNHKDLQLNRAVDYLREVCIWNH
ncbi:MAG: hypothetical protein IJK84_06535 [Bacteroidales bacterium]|nr:hypothetical protein [Bacteroidales bacterium]